MDGCDILRSSQSILCFTFYSRNIGPKLVTPPKRVLSQQVSFPVKLHRLFFYLLTKLTLMREFGFSPMPLVSVCRVAHINTSIEDAILGTARGTPDGFADFYELRYNGLTTGTFAIAELLADAPKHATALVALEARVDAA